MQWLRRPLCRMSGQAWVGDKRVLWAWSQRRDRVYSCNCRLSQRVHFQTVHLVTLYHRMDAILAAILRSFLFEFREFGGRWCFDDLRFAWIHQGSHKGCSYGVIRVSPGHQERAPTRGAPTGRFEIPLGAYKGTHKGCPYGSLRTGTSLLRFLWMISKS